MSIIIHHGIDPQDFLEFSLGERIAQFYYADKSAEKYSRIIENCLRRLLIEEGYRGEEISFIRTSSSGRGYVTIESKEFSRNEREYWDEKVDILTERIFESRKDWLVRKPREPWRKRSR